MDEPFLDGHPDNLSPLSDFKLAEEFLHNSLDRRFCAFHVVGDLLVGPTLSHVRQNSSLPLCKRNCAGGGVRAGQAIHKTNRGLDRSDAKDNSLKTTPPR